MLLLPEFSPIFGSEVSVYCSAGAHSTSGGNVINRLSDIVQVNLHYCTTTAAKECTVSVLSILFFFLQPLSSWLFTTALYHCFTVAAASAATSALTMTPIVVQHQHRLKERERNGRTSGEEDSKTAEVVVATIATIAYRSGSSALILLFQSVCCVVVCWLLKFN